MSYNAQERESEAQAAQKDLRALMKKGGHAPHCRAGEINFDPSCNICNAKKKYVQAKADLAAARAYAEI